MKPFETYPGGKGADGVYQTIINQLPSHDVFVSGFLGNCAIMRYKSPASVNIGVDADQTVIEAWEILNNSPLAPASSVLHPANQLDLLCADFFEWSEKNLKAWNFPDCLLYLDPPYLKQSRKSPADIYTFEMTVRDHERLLALALSVKAMVAISCYDNALYADYLKKWRKIKFVGKSRAGAVEETLYMNYPEPAKLHDYRYAGSNFTDRQRIKRKVERHIEKLKRLPEQERNAILHEMALSFS